jgi:hypothetical protein
MSRVESHSAVIVTKARPFHPSLPIRSLRVEASQRIDLEVALVWLRTIDDLSRQVG